ncbi:MAG: RHS repeat domain-containing protein [Planctomycetota bacterium]
MDSSGTVQERYEYDAYGNCSILEPNFAPDPGGKSDYGNPYLFTGRRLDILDSGSLKIQYNRNRYYDYYTGRFTTHDPLGITPNGLWPNRFVVPDQYQDGLGLYGYANNSPIVYFDQWGLFHPRRCWPNIIEKCGSCGPDITFALVSLRWKLFVDWHMLWDPNERQRRCDAIEGRSALSSWDIFELHNETIKGGTCDCKDTVSVNGGCYCVHEVNYFLWGVTNKLCGKGLTWTRWSARFWSTFGAPAMCFLGGVSCEGTPSSKANWAEVGFLGDFTKLKPSTSSRSFCKVNKPPKVWRGTLEAKWGD